MAVMRFKKHESRINHQYKEFLETITERVNARGLLSSEPVPVKIVELVSSKIQSYLAQGWVTEKEKILKLSALTADGIKSAYRRSSFCKEISQWLRHSLTKRFNFKAIATEIFTFIILSISLFEVFIFPSPFETLLHIIFFSFSARF